MAIDGDWRGKNNHGVKSPWNPTMVFGSGKNTGHLHNPPRFLHIHEKILEIPWVFFRFSPGFFPNRSGWHRQQTRPVASGSCGRVCGICVMDCPWVSSPRMGHVKAPWSDVPTHPPGHKNWFKCYPLVLTNIAMGNGTFIEVYIYIYIKNGDFPPKCWGLPHHDIFGYLEACGRFT